MDTDGSTSQEASGTPAAPAPWLLFIHRLPPEPAYLRVKTRRRLKRIGARLVKNSVYVIPNGDEALEDLQWLARQIVAEGGEAIVCAASFITGAGDAELESQFRKPVVTRADGVDRVEPGRTWVTRREVFVDRIASAWLIRRFIDPRARFRFAASRAYRPGADELRFDMFEAEYSHVGDACTFETLIARFGLRDRALSHIAEIVHDIDCKDEKFERPEASGVATLLRGITRRHEDDDARLERGAALFDDLYARFRRGRG